jgi:hypothetical protein
MINSAAPRDTGRDDPDEDGQRVAGVGDAEQFVTKQVHDA